MKSGVSGLGHSLCLGPSATWFWEFLLRTPSEIWTQQSSYNWIVLRRKTIAEFESSQSFQNILPQAKVVFHTRRCGGQVWIINSRCWDAGSDFQLVSMIWVVNQRSTPLHTKHFLSRHLNLTKILFQKVLAVSNQGPTSTLSDIWQNWCRLGRDLFLQDHPSCNLMKPRTWLHAYKDGDIFFIVLFFPGEKAPKGCRSGENQETVHWTTIQLRSRKNLAVLKSTGQVTLTQRHCRTAQVRFLHPGVWLLEPLEGMVQNELQMYQNLPERSERAILATG
jgi:hypothetical protein